MAKKMLIAAVLVTCYVNGVRTDVQPGETVPELSPHDEAELKRMGAVIDPNDEIAEERVQAMVDAHGDAEFAAARRGVMAADASLAAGGPAADPGLGDGAGPASNTLPADQAGDATQQAAAPAAQKPGKAGKAGKGAVG